VVGRDLELEAVIDEVVSPGVDSVGTGDGFAIGPVAFVDVLAADLFDVVVAVSVTDPVDLVLLLERLSHINQYTVNNHTET
jgi:hypothetical protein